jgi:glutamyl-tRNA reductase
LLQKDVKKIYLTTKTNSKLSDFQINDTRLNKIEFQNRYSLLDKVDCIISCTSAPHYVLYKDKFVENYKKNSLFILDLAVPRDIEPSISNLSNVKVFNMDDIKAIMEENKNKTDMNIIKGKKLLEKDIENYFLWINKTNDRCDEKILSCYA